MENKFGTSASGAMRESIGTKIDTALVPYEAVIAIATGLNYGADKYAERNYEKGLSYRQLCASIERHNKALLDGEEIDRSSGLPHFVLLASSIAMLCHNIMQGVVIDDRPEPKKGKGIDVLAEEGQRYLNHRPAPPAPITRDFEQVRCPSCGKDYMTHTVHLCVKDFP